MKMGEAWVLESQYNKELSTNPIFTTGGGDYYYRDEIIFPCVKPLYILHIYFITAKHALTNIEINILKLSAPT